MVTLSNFNKFEGDSLHDKQESAKIPIEHNLCVDGPRTRRTRLGLRTDDEQILPLQSGMVNDTILFSSGFFWT